MKRKLTINYIFNLSYQILVIVLPLITTPYISRVLGPDGVGTYSYTTSITTYFILFGCIGLNLYGQREIAYHQNDLDKRSQSFFEILLLKICTMSISIFFFAFTIQIMNQYKILFYIQIIDLIANMLDITYFYQGIEDFKKIVIRNILVKIIGIICIFAFVKTKADLPLYAVIYSLSLLLGNLSMWLTINKYIHFIPVHKLHIKKHIRPTLVLFFPQIAISIYTVLDRFMIGIITNNTIPIMFGMMGISSNLIPWFLGEEFMNSSQILMITSPIVVFMGISNIIGFQYLIPTQRQKIYTISTIIGSIVNLILNCLLIPIFLSAGAAIASVTAEFGVSIFQLYCIRKEINFIEVLKQSKLYIISSIIMFICIYFLSQYLVSTVITTFLLIFIGSSLYFGLLIILKDDLVINTLTRFFKGR